MPSQTQLTQQHRAQQIALRNVVLRDMARLWPALDWQQLDASFPKFAALVTALVKQRRRTSAGLSASYLRALRRAAGKGGGVNVTLPQIDTQAVETSLRVTSVVAAKKSAARGIAGDAAMAAALGLASGAMVTQVLNGGRDTIMLTVADDPEAHGWRRVLGGAGCDFCRAQAGKTYGSGVLDFPCHDRCACHLEPIF